ncbi:TetR-like C-terminal domain-containing protein [Streptomyces sp. NPDC005921]|uniref:TetR-like C-terminal domain-containing protein n=1 Tax=Streptomyces sp. NPDC005827 TaxID=3157070 RepID=UPI0033D44672
MTANAIYGYFANRDDLVTTLINDAYTALADAVDAAWDAAPATDPAVRVTAWATAFRTWALLDPQGFRLVYGDPVPGYHAPEGGPAPDAARRVCTGLTALAAAAWPHARHLYEDCAFDWPDFDSGLIDKVRPALPGGTRPARTDAGRPAPELKCDGSWSACSPAGPPTTTASRPRTTSGERHASAGQRAREPTTSAAGCARIDRHRHPPRRERRTPRAIRKAPRHRRPAASRPSRVSRLEKPWRPPPLPAIDDRSTVAKPSRPLNKVAGKNPVAGDTFVDDALPPRPCFHWSNAFGEPR